MQGYRLLALALGALLLFAAVVFGIRAYGSERYRAGVADTDQKWREAAEKLQEKSLASGKKADVEAAKREAVYADKLAEEKERIDDAIDAGGSPLDVMFGVR